MKIAVLGPTTLSVTMLKFIHNRVKQMSEANDTLITSDSLGVPYAMIKACDNQNIPVTCYMFGVRPKNGGSRFYDAVKMGSSFGGLWEYAERCEIYTYAECPENARFNRIKAMLDKSGKPCNLVMFPYAPGLIR